MTPQQINIAIADSLGWIFHSSGDIESPEGCLVINNTNSYPNYTADLNAMHEVENRINAQQEDLYEFWLGEITKTSSLAIRRSFVGERFNLAHATSLQRAEAYLRTIGKWNENAGTNV